MSGRKPQRVLLWTLLTIFVSVFGLTLAGIFYTGYVSQENNQKWCELLITLDDSYSATPPQSAIGQKIASDLHRLRINFEC